MVTQASQVPTCSHRRSRPARVGSRQVLLSAAEPWVSWLKRLSHVTPFSGPITPTWASAPPDLNLLMTVCKYAAQHLSCHIRLGKTITTSAPPAPFCCPLPPLCAEIPVQVRMQLLQLIFRVRRHFRRHDALPQRHKQHQPPDLRRWSDFENPFPSVSPGGYTRYYETHGGVPTPATTVVVASPVPRQTQGGLISIQEHPGEGQYTPQPHFPLSVESLGTTHSLVHSPSSTTSPTSAPTSPSSLSSPSPSSSTSPASTSTSPTLVSSSSLPIPTPIPEPSSPISARLKEKQKESRRLSTIAEVPTPKPSVPHLSRSAGRMFTSSPSGNQGTLFRLRRRQRRLLRTPSIVKECLDWAPIFTTVSTMDSLDGEGYLYLSSESSDSHWVPSTPPTTVGHELDDGEEAVLDAPKLKYSDDNDNAQELQVERPDSRSSFHSAFSHFSFCDDI